MAMHAIHSNAIPNLEEQMVASEAHARKSLEGDEFEQKHRETPPASPSIASSPEKATSANPIDPSDVPASAEPKEEDNENVAPYPQTVALFLNFWDEILKSLNKKTRNDPSTRSGGALSVQSNYSEEQVGDRLDEIEEELQQIKDMLKQVLDSSDPVHVVQEIRPLERLIRQLHIKLDGRVGGHESQNKSQHIPVQSTYGILSSPMHVSPGAASKGATAEASIENASNADTTSSRHRESTSYCFVCLLVFSLF
ncbi:hypothetical protein RFI_04789 [Reticulomyxa filosa]|uniref:Uncharacterized protein n=1 Tax=Reticulomyxa filosa TaxID=46433 RepID=X6P2M1_RETFI|nr:hypothetical protein RFI_04789 [Reticulomyxa filosa]|eukprot:ETO32329.1 hypothetical protein RFI_04789 [Reticulomyxa filosa]